MDKRLVDPGDITWEIDNAVYRVYFWDRPNITSIEYEVTGATLEEVTGWARGHAADHGWQYTLYVKVSDPDGDGMIVLEGVTGDPFIQ